MTQAEALAKFQEMRPDHAHNLAAEYTHVVGRVWSYGDVYQLWDYTGGSTNMVVYQSEESWEDALDKAKEGVHVPA
jgi:hypothetical protein